MPPRDGYIQTERLVSSDTLSAVAAKLKREAAYPTNVMMALSAMHQNNPDFLELFEDFLESCENHRSGLGE